MRVWDLQPYTKNTLNETVARSAADKGVPCHAKAQYIVVRL
jgi:hypothetical protein